MTTIKDQISSEIYKLNHSNYEGNTAFRMSSKSYTYSSYVNHAIAFFCAENWNSMALFITRAIKFLNTNGECIHPEYKKQSTKCLNLMIDFINIDSDNESAKEILNQRR